MRLGPLALALLVAGCVSAPSDAPPATNTTTQGGGDAAAPVENGTLPATGLGERAPPGTERFVLMPDHSLGVLRPGDPEMAASLVPEPLAPTTFYQSFAQPLTLTPWSSRPFDSAWESTGDIEVTIRFTSETPAASANPKAAGFPAVGGWLGTAERYAFFLLAQDAPDTLEAGEEYAVKLVATPPQGGFFVHAGEQLSIYTFLSYQAADGRSASYVVGGPDPAGILLPHTHFNLSAPRETVILEESGDLPPNPGPTGDMMQDPPTFSFNVPPDALYVVGYVEGASKTGTRSDIDLAFLASGGEAIAVGSSPHASELVAMGPGNLQAYGRDLVARVTGSVIPAGGTYSVRIVAYGP